MDAQLLKAALARWADAMKKAAAELNELDGRLGDGDLGATLERCATNIEQALPAMPDSLEAVFRGAAQACAKASGSSFGTLLAAAFLGSAKWVPPRETLSPHQIAELLSLCVTQLAARGGASLGDKTMLDSLDAIARALEQAPLTADARAVAVHSALQALDDYRGRPNKVGRARMFADRSVGLDDPGMVAVLRMAEAI